MNRWRVIITPQSASLLSPTIQTQATQQQASSNSRKISTRSKQGGKKNGGENSWGAAGAVAAASATALACKLYQEKDKFLVQAKEAKVEITAEQIAYDNRVRQYNTPDNIFNYFSSIQLVNKFGMKTTMMSPMDFYSAITPDCSIHPGAGSGIYEEIKEENLGKVNLNKSPVGKESVLNQIGAMGLISYSDYCFLLTLLATPVRFIETAFNVFDVTGDGKVEPKEFAFVSTKLAHKSGGFGSYTDVDQTAVLASNSGLLNYVFGKDRKGTLTKENFKKLQADLLNEVIQIEFNEYDKGNTGRISEEDFCKFLLKRTKIPPSQKAKMLKRVKSIWPAKARGVSFPSFKNFFLVLASGTELERGLFFLDVENIGVDLVEFRQVASWVSHSELSEHIAEVVFVLLDDQGQGRIFKENVGPVLFDWRQPRGFDKSAIHVQMGNLKI